MWGNALGWTISLLIVAATATGLALLERHLADVTPTTDLVRDPATLAPVALPVAPDSVVAPSDACDAGPIYRQAIERVLADADAYERFAGDGRTSDEARSLGALDLLLSARPCAHMSLFTAAPGEVVNYGMQPQLRALRMCGLCAVRLGLLLNREGKPDEAMKQFEAAFALGARLYEERLVLDELLVGLELMSAAARAMVGGNAQARSFLTGLQEFDRARLQPLRRAIGSIDPGVIATHSGDVFHIARHAKERMWRVEAILKLGRMRYNAARLADQQAAERALDELRDDPDAVIRAAANAAKNLSIEQYRMLG
jgi:tetratricopeptide (TPR) repeat protein